MYVYLETGTRIHLYVPVIREWVHVEIDDGIGRKKILYFIFTNVGTTYPAKKIIYIYDSRYHSVKNYFYSYEYSDHSPHKKFYFIL